MFLNHLCGGMDEPEPKIVDAGNPDITAQSVMGVAIAAQRIAAQELVHVVVHHDAERRRDCLHKEPPIAIRDSFRIPIALISGAKMPGIT
jgi:hypothetical protein